MSLMCLVLYKRGNSVSHSPGLSIRVSSLNYKYYCVTRSIRSPIFIYTADVGRCDRAIDPNNRNQYIVWGIGALGETAFRHHTMASGESVMIS